MPGFFGLQFVLFGDIKRKNCIISKKKLLTENFYAHFLAFTVCSVNNPMICRDNFSRQIQVIDK